MKMREMLCAERTEYLTNRRWMVFWVGRTRTPIRNQEQTGKLVPRGTVSCTRPPGQLLTDQGCTSVLLVWSMALSVVPILFASGKMVWIPRASVSCLWGNCWPWGTAQQNDHCRDLNFRGEWARAGVISCCWRSEVKGPVVPESPTHRRTYPFLPDLCQNTDRQTDMQT